MSVGLLFPEVSAPEIARVDVLRRGTSSAIKYAPSEVRTVADLRTLNALPCQVRACDSSGKTLRGGLVSLDARGELAGRSARRAVMPAAAVDKNGDPTEKNGDLCHEHQERRARGRWGFNFFARCLVAAKYQVGDGANDDQLFDAYIAIRDSETDPPAFSISLPLSSGVAGRCHSFCPLDRRSCSARRARFSPLDAASLAGPLHLDPCVWFAEELREVVVAVLARSCAEPVLFWCPESLPDAAAVLVRPVKNADSADVDAALERLMDGGLFRPRF